MAKSYQTAAIIYGTLLLGFTGYLMLDTFVLSSAEKTGTTEMNLSMFADDIKTTAPQMSADTETETKTASGTDQMQNTEKKQTADKTEAPADSALSTDAPASGTKKQSGTSAAKQNDAAAQSEQGKTTGTAASSAAKTTKAATTVTEPPATNPPETEPPVTEPELIINDSVYQDGNISITLSQYEEYGTSVYVADVRLSSAQYLKTAFANDTYGKNITAPTSDIAAANNAILAVNGDFYGTHNTGYVIRNGVLYRDLPRNNTDFLCIMADGSFFLTTSDEYTAQELLDMGAWQCFMFGPRLIENGAVTVDENSEVARAMASNPRTAIGIVDDLHYIFVVSDGRTSDSDGLSLSELANFMQSLGAQTAYNLDGGGSSTMIFNGSLINNPTTSGRSIRERSVSDIVYIGY